MIINKEVGNRISMLRFLMIFGVILLHTPPNVSMAHLDGSMFHYTVAFFQSAMFRSTVPLLTFVSGYLLFNANGDLNLKKLIQKKALTLGVPFMVFNLGLLALVYFAQLTDNRSAMYQHYLPDASLTQWLSAAFAVFENPVNYPLHFLRDIFILMLLSPIIGVLLRHHPIIGLVAFFLFFMNNFDGGFVLRNNMPVNFYLGGLIAVWKIDTQKLDKYAPILFAAFLGICLAMVVLRVTNTNYIGFIAPFLLWPATSLIVNTRFGKWAAKAGQYSFFMFIAHAPVVAILDKLYYKVKPIISMEIYWALIPVVTTIFLIGVYKVAMYLFPTVFSVMVGCYFKKPVPAFVERRNWDTRPASWPVSI